jgi:small GTP-binding protein
MSASSKKVIVLGDSGVGKTALVQRFVRGTFSIDYRPTAGAVPYTKTVELDGKIISLVIWDVAGHTFGLHPAFTSEAHGAVLVCDLSKPVTLDSVLKWHKVIRDKLGDVPVIVASNKSDVCDTDYCEGLHKAGYKNFKTSAKTGENVDKLFMALINAIA